MKLHGQYLRLHSRFGLTGEAEVTMDELAAVLDCTRRNAMNIVQSMTERGWIDWQARRGRGLRSTLTFLAPPEDIAAQAMLHTMNQRDIGRALDQISAHSDATALQDRLQGWLLSYFGHHSETQTGKRIDTLRLPLREQIQTVDPLSINLLAESFVASHVFDGLVRRAPEGGSILPNLAHAWETDAERKRWTFYLRKEVLFHNGKVMTADDVVYSLQRLAGTSRRMLYSSIIKTVESVNSPYPHTVVVVLKEPNELFLPFLCTTRAAVVPRDLEQLGERFGTAPVGTGPFKLTALNGRRCVLEAFTHYFQGRAHIDRVEIFHVPWNLPDETDDKAEQASPFHVVHNPQDGTDGDWSQINSPASVRKFMTCNTHRPGALADPQVRAGLFACLEGIEPDKSPAADIPDKTIRMATIDSYRHDAELAAERLRRCGYLISVTAVSAEEFKGPIRMEADLIIFSLLRDRDEQLRLFDLYRTIASHIDPHIRLDMELLLTHIAKQPDPVLREEAFRKIERQLIAEHQLHILYEKPVQTAYLPSVRGVTFNAQGWIDLRHLWFPPQ
ncbi:ABC transporter substrate-binding protein [Paenibacillus sp. NPDC058071]|uniref:ABC transporter substrate-binding protein n=1 Tax=Paenibacillus sp. NPDC058071 TaxID=3346326 RepID=UPI0036D8A4AB